MRAQVRVRSTSTRGVKEVSWNGDPYKPDAEGWLHFYDVGAYELKKLVRAFAEIEVEMWGETEPSERAEMEAILNA